MAIKFINSKVLLETLVLVIKSGYTLETCDSLHAWL